MNLLRELAAVCNLEWQRLRASPRVILLAIFYALSGAMVVLILGFASGQVQAQLNSSVGDPAARDAAMAQMRVGTLGLLFDQAAPETIETLAKVPLIVFLGVRAALFFVPLWVALLGFDVVSEELSTRSIRYVSFRARRSALVIGKFVALGSLLVGLLFLLSGGLVLYGRHLEPEFSGGLFFSIWARCWGAASLFALGYLALTVLCSTLVRTPSVSLVLNVMALFGFWVANLLGERARVQREGGDTSLIGRVWEALQIASPSHHGPALLHPDPSHLATGAAAFAGFIVVFVGCACLLLERRDL